MADLYALRGTESPTLPGAVALRASAQAVEAIVEAPGDENDPVEMTAEESGTLLLVLKTAIDVLDDARPRLEAGGRRAYRATVKR